MPSLKRLIKVLLNATVTPLIALLLIFEEWGWEPLARAMARLGRMPVWSQLEAWIRRLPPYAALCAFFVPMLSLLPIKLLAFYWISKGHAVLGLLVVLAAKVLGTAMVARLFILTQTALMSLPWFARLYVRWKTWKDRVMAQVKSGRPWRLSQALARKSRRGLRRMLEGLRRAFR